jgi:folylpolyglutamate synthase
MLTLIREAKRVLIFNCTHGRSGTTLLGALLDSFRTKLDAYNSETTLDAFFDDVIFCTNITYSDGTFKGGTQPL